MKKKEPDAVFVVPFGEADKVKYFLRLVELKGLHVKVVKTYRGLVRVQRNLKKRIPIVLFFFYPANALPPGGEEKCQICGYAWEQTPVVMAQAAKRLTRQKIAYVYIAMDNRLGEQLDHLNVSRFELKSSDKLVEFLKS